MRTLSLQQIGKVETLTGKPIPTDEPSERVEWKGINLLSFSGNSVAKYGRKVGHQIWSDDEIIAQMVFPRKSSSSQCRPAFPDVGKQIWES